MRLVADIGGTNARFARAAPGGAPGPVLRLRVADHPSFEDALAAFLAAEGGGASEGTSEIAIAAAGPVIGGAVRLTNAHWEISPAAVARVLPGARVAILNDLAAVAHLLPRLGPEGAETLRPGAPDGTQPMIAVNVGTGFGASVAVPVRGGWAALATEAGHMSLAPASGEDAALMAGAATGAATGTATVEALLSGPGHARLAARAPAPEVRRLVSALLGRVAGDLVLATGAWGGLFLCGGVLEDFDAVIDRALFLERLLARTGVAARLAAVPVRRITAANPALAGLAAMDWP
ncbi:glucokinase [Paralimibaculum aggregatum]|uniref:Glucokinase n=1 Tax=Paralimibaculum aggregatum TaxID=3036245 RepID=A0ABQ6LIR5_9RHOB|nr:glucokinase [Limibaculum sp. NKW23]GMG82044.1 glucokinase [Limibaculum sp. NKW23]